MADERKLTKGLEPKPVPLGPKPRRDAATREALATVTPGVEEKARGLWEANAPEGAEGMISSVDIEEKGDAT